MGPMFSSNPSAFFHITITKIWVSIQDDLYLSQFSNWILTHNHEDFLNHYGYWLKSTETYLFWKKENYNTNPMVNQIDLSTLHNFFFSGYLLRSWSFPPSNCRRLSNLTNTHVWCVVIETICPTRVPSCRHLCPR